ncbi:cupin domain-containing protein [Longitalea luteola]|uniref:cupin domain-containing protein n=1 Tax=Longitalea luteola TaxID=2812563 RepID=UPI001A959509|nr:cupin domain-containing protein [Longitalea luteola]
MTSKFCFRICYLLSFVIGLAGCNDQAETNTPAKTNATSSDTSTTRYTPFDTARGVTRISPRLYKKLADTLNVRVIQGIYKPGDSSIMHAHPDFAMYVLEGGTVELTAEDGKKQNIEFKKDMAVVLPAATHSAKNIGKSTLKVIVVEVNRPRD